MARKGDEGSSKRFAAYMKAHHIVRTTGRCGACYSIHEIESYRSKYRHRCRI
jgi:hypothetical protein